MSALPGSHYCKEHQGNHSHYDSENCEVCKLKLQLKTAEERADYAWKNTNILEKDRKEREKIVEDLKIKRDRLLEALKSVLPVENKYWCDAATWERAAKARAIIAEIEGEKG